MTKRLFAGVLLSAFVSVTVAKNVLAERPSPREWRPDRTSDLQADQEVPPFIRADGGTTWVRVHPSGQSPCSPADIANSPGNQSVEHVWCFEGAGGDSSWPAVPGAQDTGSKHEDWDHWSLFAPPIPPASKWHVTTFLTGASGGNYNAYGGCEGLVSGCDDVAFWVFDVGYGDDWNFSLQLDCAGENTAAGGTIEFDLRYDNECNYDYMYLEYWNFNASQWHAVVDSAGTEAVFNSVSGNPDVSNGGTGRSCGDDIYGHSDQFDFGSGNVPYHGNSAWVEDVTFPLPATGGSFRVRWRVQSDGAWSDADGRGDTDGLGAIDNVRVSFNGSGNVMTDDFETGDFSGIRVNGAPSAACAWTPGGLEGNTYDGWHLTFDPMYKNKGSTCTFSDDWMWAAKPDTGPIPENGFQYFLATPVVDTNGWTGGIIEYSQYICMDSDREDFVNELVRFYDTSAGTWSLWNDIDGFITFAGCEFWNFNQNDDLTPYLSTTVDSVQFAFLTLDVSQDGEFSWGKHGSVQHLIDNVSFGSFNGEATVFTARNIDIFGDTFSLSDPAHTPQRSNDDQGKWNGLNWGSGGDCTTVATTLSMAQVDSLNVNITDFNGVTASNVLLFWRHNQGGTVDITAQSYNSKPMVFAVQDPSRPTDEGTYRGTIGVDDGGVEDQDGTAGNCRLWSAGTTVEYYVQVTDDIGNTAQFLTNLGDPFQFSIFPLGNETADGKKILLVDDYTRGNLLDFENSSGFQAAGGAGFGNFSSPVATQPDQLYIDALDMVFPTSNSSGINNSAFPHHFDKFDVQGAGSSVQGEPRGVSDESRGLLGFMDDFGAPVYDALIWLHGTFDEGSYADTTRLELGTYLDAAGNLLSTGDDVAFHLGSSGINADSSIAFITTYLGTDIISPSDDETDNRALNVCGVAGTSLEGTTYGLYGECPVRLAFDRLTLSSPAAGSANEVLMEYCDGGGGDNGRAAVIKNTRTSSGGVAVHTGFDLSGLLSRETMACFLDAVLTTDFGLFGALQLGGCSVINGVDAPEIANSFAFELAPASPNPFDSSTRIRFSVATRTHVSVEVYNILGQKVRTLVDEQLTPNSYVRAWDGRTDGGERASSGIYFYKMVAGDFSDTRKTVLLR